jgi:hypothetical protein
MEGIILQYQKCQETCVEIKALDLWLSKTFPIVNLTLECDFAIYWPIPPCLDVLPLCN